MTPYWIFVIAITIAYIIYYGYNISKDVYGKKSDKTSTAEVFDMKSLASEVTATPVKEVDGGFSFGDNVVEAATSADPEKKHAGNKFANLELDEANVQSEGGMNTDQLFDWMVDHDMNNSSSEAYRKSKIDEERQVL
jgi:hypothetical protein